MRNTEEINIFEYLLVVWRRRRLIVAVVGIITTVAAVYAFRLPKSYRTSATIMTLGQDKSGGLSTMLAASLGSIGGALNLSGSGATAQLLALLTSRSLTERVIQDSNVIPLLYGDQPRPELYRMIQTVRQAMKFEENAETRTMYIIAESHSPELALELAQAYLHALQMELRENAFSSAKQYRLFLEQRVAQNKRELLEAGKTLNSFYKEGRISSIDSKLDVPIELPFISAEVEPETWREVNKMYAELGGMHATALSWQREKQSVVHDVPQQVYLQYLSLHRELLGKLNALLTQQYEMAKMEEARDGLTFSVVDQAVLPHERFKPNRRLIVLVSFLAALGVGVFAAFVREWTARELNARRTG